MKLVEAMGATLRPDFRWGNCFLESHSKCVTVGWQACPILALQGVINITPHPHPNQQNNAQHRLFMVTNFKLALITCTCGAKKHSTAISHLGRVFGEGLTDRKSNKYLLGIDSKSGTLYL